MVNDIKNVSAHFIRHTIKYVLSSDDKIAIKTVGI